jgi:hypothetical protein
VVVVVIKIELACGCWRLATCFLLTSCVSLCGRDARSTLTGLSECEPSDMLVMLLLCCRRQVHVWAAEPRGRDSSWTLFQASPAPTTAVSTMSYIEIYTITSHDSLNQL